MTITTPQIRRSIGLPKQQISYIARNTPFTYMQVVSQLNKMLHYILDSITRLLKDWINNFVPKRTGQLRNALLKSLEQSYVKYGLLKLIVGSRLPYAEDANNWATFNVAHFGTWFEHSGRRAYAYYGGHHGPIYLDDPLALGHWMQEMIAYINEKAADLLSIGLNMFFSGSSKIAEYIKTMVK